MTNSPLAGASARPLASACPQQTAASIIAAAHDLLGHLAAGRRIDAPAIRTAMQSAFGTSDASGAWDWKAAYEAVEVAQLLFMRRYGPAIHAKTSDPFERLKLVERIARLTPTQTRRSEEMLSFQQFSTPLGLAWVVGFAAAFSPGELVLEPSAGTGLLAIQAELAGCRLAVNEVADTRSALLGLLFDGGTVTTHDAAQIHDRLDASVVPSCMMMNPPFSTAINVETRVADAAFRHLSSAVARLVDGGRLVAITGANCAPDHKAWRDGFVRLQEKARVVFTGTIAGSVFAPHGTSVETRLTVIDKVPADDPTQFPASRGMAPDLATLLRWLTDSLPPRSAVAASMLQPLANSRTSPATEPATPKPRLDPAPAPEPTGIPLDYGLIDWQSPSDGKLSDTLYEPYTLQSIYIAGANPHPTRLVQSAAMASVAPPKPSYRPHLPGGLVEQGLLSDAQLESVIYAGEAHADHLAGNWTVDATWDKVEAAPDNCDTAVRFRKGWFLGDGTGTGKGRQVAGIVLDNWLKGRRRAVWISKSDKLLEDAQRDWRALEQEPLLVTPLARFRQGTPIRLEQGILFTTYATLRSDARENRVSRVFAASKPLSGSLAATYLRRRGISRLTNLDALRFHPRCYYRANDDDVADTPGAFPALIAAVTDHDGAQTGTHRTWLNPTGLEKAKVASPRRAMGHILGHAVRFGHADDVLIAGEGIETMLSLREVLPTMPMAAATSSAHLAAILFPPTLKRLYVARDRDAAGDSAFGILTDRAKAVGIELVSLMPELNDFNDDLQEHGASVLGQRVCLRLQEHDRTHFSNDAG